MINKLLGVLVLLALGYGVYYLVTYYKDFEQKQAPLAVNLPADPNPPVPGDPNIPSESLAGLPQRLEAGLKAAYAQGATGLGTWLRVNRRYTGDPRLAAVELDYAVLLSRTNPDEAKKVFQSVSRRTKPDSPIYARVKKLEALFQ